MNSYGKLEKIQKTHLYLNTLDSHQDSEELQSQI